jgi:hypothetical protein
MHSKAMPIRMRSHSLWSRSSGLGMCPAKEQEMKNGQAEMSKESLQTCTLKEHIPSIN